MSFILILQVHRRLHHLWDLHTHQINEKQNFETVDWFEFLTFVTINLILHLAWFLVLPLVTEKIDCSLKLCCVTIRKMTKICNVIWVSLHSGGEGWAHFSGRSAPKRDGNDLSVVYWFIHEVCSLYLLFECNLLDVSHIN